MNKKLIIGLVLVSGCAAAVPTQHQVKLASSGRVVDFLSQRVDNKDCPTGVVHYVFDAAGAIIGSATFQGSTFYCHAIDQLGGIAQGVGLGVGLSNLRPARTTNDLSNRNAQEQGQTQSTSIGSGSNNSTTTDSISGANNTTGGE